MRQQDHRKTNNRIMKRSNSYSRTITLPSSGSLILRFMRWHSSISIMTGYGQGNQGLIPTGAGISLCYHAQSIPALGPPRISTKCKIFLLQRLDCENTKTYNLTPFNMEIYNVWSCTSMLLDFLFF
jgi:hypothetical protein